MTARDPASQFQIGEPVLYVADGVFTTVTGYVWAEAMSGPPKLVAYKLACGISVPEGAIRKVPQNAAPRELRFKQTDPTRDFVASASPWRRLDAPPDAPPVPPKTQS